MKLIMTTYPGFQELPKGVRKMLLVSESFFFDEMRQPSERPAAPGSVATSNLNGLLGPSRTGEELPWVSVVHSHLP